MNGELIIGKGMPASDLPAASWMSAMNVCDETVDGAARYRCGCLITADGDTTHRDNLEPILQSAAAALVERVDGDQPLVGANQPIVATLTDDDLIVSAPATFQAKRSRSELVNSVFGSYNSPEDLWSATAYPPKIDATALAADRERHAQQIDFSTVYDKGQAIRLADIAVRENRYQASATITVRPRWIVLEAGDWIRWNSARRGNRVYRVTGRSLAPLNEQGARNVTLSLQEVGTGIYDSSVVIPEATPRTNPVAPVYTLTVENFITLASSVTAPSGRSYPAIEARWDVIDDVTVDSVIVEYWKTSDPAARLSKSVTMPAVYVTIVEGVLPVTSYTARARVVTNPPRDAIWSREWTITTLTEDLVFAASQLAAEVTQILIHGQEVQAGFDALVEGLASSVSATTVHLQLESARLNSKTFQLDSDVADVGARLISEQFLREEGDEVVAAAVTRAEARLDSLATGQSGQAVALDSLTVRVSDTETGLESVAESVDGIRTEVEDPVSGLLAQGSALQALQSTSSAANGAATSTVQAIAELTATLDVLAANAAATQAGALQAVRLASARIFDVETASVARDEAQADRTTGVEARLTSAESGIAGNAAALNGQAIALSTQSAKVTALDATVTATAAALSGVQAAVDNVSASGLISFQVTAASGSGSTAFSRISILAKASAGDTFKETGLYIETTPTSSTILMKADKVVITDGTTNAFPFVVSGGVVKLNLAYFAQLLSINNKMLIDGRMERSSSVAIDRFILQDDRILLSKLGKTASLTMADADKVFDSNWDFTGTVITRGVIIDTAVNNQSPGVSPDLTLSSAPLVVAVPLPFTPRDLLVILRQCRSSLGSTTPQNGISLNTELPSGRYTYSGGVLTIRREEYFGSGRYSMGDIVYRMYSV